MPRSLTSLTPHGRQGTRTSGSRAESPCGTSTDTKPQTGRVTEPIPKAHLGVPYRDHTKDVLVRMNQVQMGFQLHIVAQHHAAPAPEAGVSSAGEIAGSADGRTAGAVAEWAAGPSARGFAGITAFVVDAGRCARRVSAGSEGIATCS